MDTKSPVTTPAVQDGEPQQFGFLIADVLRLSRADFAARARGTGLTTALHRLLLYVHRNEGCRQVELADWLDIRPVTVGRMIDRLEKQRLLRREPDPVDRRASRVHLGEAAGPMMAQLRAVGDLVRARALQGFTQQERRALVDALERVRDNLSTDSARRARSRGASRGR